MDRWARQFTRYRDRGDLGALGRVFDALAPRLLSVALHLCGEPGEAEDAVQETFLLAMRRAEAFDPRRPLEPWLAGLLHNVARNLRRQRARRRTETLPEVADRDGGPADRAGHAEQVAALRAHVARFPDEQRQVLLLHLEHGLAPAEMAEVLGVAPGAVRMRLHRALRRLRGILPVGLAAALLSEPARGLAVVRAVVLREGGRKAATVAGATALIGGGLVMKKVLFGGLAVLLVGLTWWGSASWGNVPFGDGEPPPGASPARGRVPAAEVEPPAAASGPAQRAPAVAGTGSLLVRVRARGGKEDAGGAPDDSMPIQGAALRIWPGTVPVAPFDDTPLEVRSDEEGEVRLTGLDPGPWQVLAAFDREARARSVVVEPGSEARVDIVRPAAGIVRGRVVDEAGAPVADAEVWVMRGTSLSVLGRDGLPVRHWDCLRIGARTDGRGRFRFARFASEARVAARKPGFAASYARSLSDRVGDGLTLVLGSEPATVTGTVRDHEGEPVRGALVTVHPPGRDTRRTRDGTLLQPRLPEFVQTGMDGRYRFEDLPPGHVRITAGRPLVSNGGNAEADLGPGSHEVVDLSLGAFVAVQGRVVYADGTPAFGSGVAVRPDAESRGHYCEGGVREDGSYCLPFVPVDRPCVVAVESPNGHHAVEEIADADPGWIRLDFVLEDVAPLRGRVVGPHGEGLKGWLLVARGSGDGASLGSSYTDEDGRFTLACLPLRDLHLAALPPGGDRPLLERPHVRAGNGGLTLRVTEDALPSAVLRGRVLDSRGAPVFGAEVVLRREGRRGLLAQLEGMTSVDGAFEFTALPAGTFIVEVAPPDLPLREWARCTVEHGEQVDLATRTLPPPAHLRIEIRRPGGGAWSGALPGIAVHDAQGKRVDVRAEPADGAWHLAVPCPGEGSARFRVQPVGTDLITEARELELEPGTRRTLRFEVSIGRTRDLVFNGYGRRKLRARKVLHIEIRAATGGLVHGEDLRGNRWSLMGYRYWSLRHPLPFGRYRITARSEDGTRYATTFEVTDALDQPTRIDVPVVE